MAVGAGADSSLIFARARERDHGAREERLMAAGLITSLPEPALDVNDDVPDDQPVTVMGEPLSETIIRERR